MTPHGSDARVRMLLLTEAGVAERELLDRLSDELAGSLLAPLDEGQRERLVDAVTTVERLLTASLVQVRVEDPSGEAGRFCVTEYFRELDERFDNGFDPAKSTSVHAIELTEPSGLFLIARLHEEPIGCGGLMLRSGEPAQVKWMWVSPEARGLGLGRRILTELERHAAERGAEVLSLETNRSLVEAIGLYRSAGYREVDPFNDEPFAHHWFEKRIEPVSARASRTVR